MRSYCTSFSCCIGALLRLYLALLLVFLGSLCIDFLCIVRSRCKKLLVDIQKILFRFALLFFFITNVPNHSVDNLFFRLFLSVQLIMSSFKIYRLDHLLRRLACAGMFHCTRTDWTSSDFSFY